MDFLQKYKVLGGEPGYNKWLEGKEFTVGGEYVSVGFSRNTGTLPNSIHLINRLGIIVNLVYTEDRFSLVG